MQKSQLVLDLSSSPGGAVKRFTKMVSSLITLGKPKQYAPTKVSVQYGHTITDRAH